jgi:hypothetical protein
MPKPIRTFAAIAMLLAIAACTTPPEGLLNAANRNYMRYAMGKPYAEMASLNPTTMEGLAGRTAYGPMIGTYALADGNRVYRHIDDVQTGESTVDLGIFSQRHTVSSTYRLAYFRVGPDGIVNDWAVGSLPGGSVRCVSYAIGIFRKCEDQQSLRQSMTLYDSLVRTSAGQPLSSWGAPVEPDLGAMSLANGENLSAGGTGPARRR